MALLSLRYFRKHNFILLVSFDDFCTFKLLCKEFLQTLNILLCIQPSVENEGIINLSSFFPLSNKFKTFQSIWQSPLYVQKVYFEELFLSSNILSGNTIVIYIIFALHLFHNPLRSFL